MIFPLAFLAGAAIGWRRAARRGGDRLDRLQYAAAHGIALTLLVFALVVIGQNLGLL